MITEWEQLIAIWDSIPSWQEWKDNNDNNWGEDLEFFGDDEFWKG